MIHEYGCKVCGYNMEVSQRITDEPRKLLFCPVCRRIRSVKRLISKTSFILKGTWAKDGYADTKE